MSRYRKAEFDVAHPCRYRVESPPFRDQFGILKEADSFSVIVSYCGAQSGGSLGRSEIVLYDRNGELHLFEFETFFNGHEALTLGRWLRPHATAAIARGL
jgi:hypothetical protein